MPGFYPLLQAVAKVLYMQDSRFESTDKELNERRRADVCSVKEIVEKYGGGD
jgi:hypothetical protein